jgi:hypothetical protein
LHPGSFTKYNTSQQNEENVPDISLESLKETAYLQDLSVDGKGKLKVVNRR